MGITYKVYRALDEKYGKTERDSNARKKKNKDTKRIDRSHTSA